MNAFRSNCTPNGDAVEVVHVNAPPRLVEGLIELLDEPLSRDDDGVYEIDGMEMGQVVLTWRSSGAIHDALESLDDGSRQLSWTTAVLDEGADDPADVRKQGADDSVTTSPPAVCTRTSRSSWRRRARPRRRGVRSDASLIHIQWTHQDPGTHDERGKLRGGPTHRTGTETISWAEFIRRMESEARSSRRTSPYGKYGSGYAHGLRDPRTGQVTEVWGLVIDLDGLPQAGLDLALEHLRGIGDGLWQATTSDTPERRRVRVLLPFTEVISPKRYRRIARVILDGLARALADAGYDPGAVDRASESPGQQWLFGRRPDGGSVPQRLGGGGFVPPSRVKLPPKSETKKEKAPASKNTVRPEVEVHFADGHAATVQEILAGSIRPEGEKCYDPRRADDTSPGCICFPGGIWIPKTGEYIRFADTTERQPRPTTDAVTQRPPPWVLLSSRTGDLGADTHVVIDERYVPRSVLRTADVLALASACGTGKTELLRCLPGKRVLIVMPRISLRRELARRLGYPDEVVDALPDEDTSLEDPFCDSSAEPGAQRSSIVVTPDGRYTICCPESLLGVTGDFDYVVIEESETVFPQIVSSTCGARGPNILRRLRDLCENARVLMTDAHLSSLSIDSLRDVVPRRAITYVENVHEHGRSICLHGGRNSLRAELYRILSGEAEGVPEMLRGIGFRSTRVLVCCAAKELARTLAKDIRNRYPDLRLKLVTGDDTSRQDYDPTMLDEGPHDVLIATSAVGVGVDMQSNAWDAVFVFGGSHLGVRDQLQMMVRSRHPWCRTVHAHVPNYHSQRPTDPEIIDEQVREAHRETLTAISRMLGPDWMASYYVASDGQSTEIPDDAYHRLVVRTMAVRHLETSDYRAAFIAAAEIHGWLVVAAEPPVAEVGSLRPARDAQRRERVEALAGAEPIEVGDVDTVEALERAEATSRLTLDEQQRLERHRTERVLGPAALDNSRVRDLLTKDTRAVERVRELAQILASYTDDGIAGLGHQDSQRIASGAPQRCRHLLRRVLARRKVLDAWGIHDLSDPSTWDTDEHDRAPALVEPELDVTDILGVRTRQQASDLLGVGLGSGETATKILHRVLEALGLRLEQVRAKNGTRFYNVDRDRLDFMLDLASYEMLRIEATGERAIRGVADWTANHQVFSAWQRNLARIEALIETLDC